MPELPEVETIVQDLCGLHFVGKTIQNVDVLWNKSISSPSLEAFCDQTRQQKITKIYRRGKFIVFDLSKHGHIAIHLRMSGRLVALSAQDPLQKHDRVVFHFTDGWTLRFHDTRKFGRMTFVSDLQRLFAQLGPEPLDPNFCCDDFHRDLLQRSGKIKSVLLDQSFIAGLGNIYVDEALWHASLHPARIARELSYAESMRLFSSVQHVLHKSIQAKGTSLGRGKGNFHSVLQNFGENQALLQVYRRHGQPCLRCTQAVERIVLAQRGTHFCPSCQVIPK